MIFLCLFFISLLAAEPSRFVHEESGFVVVEKVNDQIYFNDPILEAEMLKSGVAIPPAHQSRYGGAERVKLDEERFFEAFQEFYTTYIFDPTLYHWE